MFVTGSDQVWHPQAVCDAYLLKFADSDKVKLSYAASVAHDELTEAEKNRYKSAFADYKAISVREENAIELLQDLSPVKIQWVLDPTLLISKEEWLEIATDYRIEDKYLFCFFLGDDVRQRELSKEYAEKKGLKIVTLPHLNGYKKCDKLFGDYQLYDVDPRRLISIVNNAECIFTDSFHMTVFSLILQKQHFVFQRSGAKSMSSRIYSLISMFDTASHFCDDDSKVTYEYIDGVEKIDYSVKFEKYEKMKARSIEFLKNNIAIKE